MKSFWVGFFSSDDSFGTNKNINNARIMPKIDVYQTLSSPAFWVIKAAINGPRANPSEPKLTKMPMFLEQFWSEKKLTNPIDCGWKKLPPKQPSIINIFRRMMLGAEDARGMNIDARIKPQKMKNLFKLLSAKNPKIGCSMFEQI